MSKARIFRQFVQYVVVGGLAFMVDFVSLFVVTEGIGLHYLISASLGFSLGLITNYLLCIAWIFDFRAVSNRAHEFAIFCLVGIAGLMLNNLLMFVFTELVGLHYLFSKVGSAALILIFNFSLRRSLLFAERKTAAP